MSNEAKNIQQEQAPEMSVLIIAHKQSQLASAAAFLSRRGVHCTVKGNIRDGIQHITSKKATLVFLSWNLPNANVVKTYQLLTQNFKVECVVFAERPDGKTAAELASSRLPEIMQAPVSGPGLYMRIQKLLKAKEEQAKADKHLENHTTNHNYNQNDGKIVLKSSSSPSEDEGGFINLGSSHQQSDKPGVINFQSPKYSTEDYETEIQDDSANDISAYLNQIEPETQPSSITQEGIKRGILHEADDEGIKRGKLHEMTNEGIKRGEQYEAESNGTSNEELKSPSRQKKEVSYGSVVNVAKKNKSIEANLAHYEVTKAKEAKILTPENKTTDGGLIIDFKPRAGAKDSESLLSQKTFEAIQKSVRPAYEDYKGVDVVSKAKIFNIHTPRFRGYLIFVVPMFNELDRGVISRIKENLENSLKEENEYLLYFEELNIDLEQIDFLGWAEKNAEFFVQTVDHKTEIVCAYYPQTPSMPVVKEASNKMATVNIKDLKENTKTNFNLYIHLPKNNKYVKYIKTGETITDSHTQKFEKHKMESLHIKNEEVTSFKEYFVSNQMNDIIKKKVE